MTLHVLPSGYVFNDEDVSDILFIDNLLSEEERIREGLSSNLLTVRALIQFKSQKYAKEIYGDDLKALLAWRSSLNQLTVPSASLGGMKHLQNWGMDFP